MVYPVTLFNHNSTSGATSYILSIMMGNFIVSKKIDVTPYKVKLEKFDIAHLGI